MSSRIISALLSVWFCPILLSAEWQWSTTVDSVASSETNDHPRAFLWIPPDCQRVRAVVVGQHNMEEEPILEHEAFRKTMAELGIAEIWITPGIDLVFNFEKGAGDAFNEMMRKLADESGYTELIDAPIIPIGHSAAASFPWNFAAWNPERTLCALSVSGQWPYYKGEKTSPNWGDRNVDGVPGLVTMGEYEWADDNWAKGAQQRQDHPMTPLSMLGCPGDGHFAPLDDKIDFLCLYVRKACEFRLPKETPTPGPVKLNPIDPTKQGWLADRYRKDKPPAASAAPVSSYQGNKAEAFWYFDATLAQAVDDYAKNQRAKKPQLLGYLQNGEIVSQNPKLHQQVPLKFLPEEDGLTFTLKGTFLETVPEGRPTRWTDQAKDTPITHAAGGDIAIRRICGPVQQVGPDEWAIRFYRMGMNNPKRSNDIWFVAIHEGDSTYKRIVQQASMRFPLTNKEGVDQTINFDSIADQKVSPGTLTLNATSSAGAKVHFYVREGPAEIGRDNTLRFTAIPPRAKYPIKVTVVAWQWGRSIDPKLKTAVPVEMTFSILSAATRAHP